MIIATTKARKRRKIKATSSKFLLHLPDADRAIYYRLIERAARLKLKYSVAYILRQGARMFCRQQNLLLGKVEKGQYHVKKRKQN